MLNFERSFTIQFSIFFPEGVDGSVKDVDGLSARIAAKAGADDLGLTGFREPTEGQALIAQAGAPFGPLPTWSWVSKTGIWKLVFNPLRLDVFFDARTYAELFPSPRATPPALAARVAGNLATARDALKGRAARLAMIVNAQAGKLPEAPSSIIAQQFANDDLRRAASDGKAVDLLARVNKTAEWVLNDGASAVQVNRIETATANVSFKDGAAEESLAWSFDVNTSPVHDQLDLNGPSVRRFFAEAAGWIDGRLTELKVQP